MVVFKMKRVKEGQYKWGVFSVDRKVYQIYGLYMSRLTAEAVANKL